MAKVRTPRIYGHDALEAVLINTAGGLTGGDRVTVEITAGAGSDGVFTTQAAEKLYRSSGGQAVVRTRLRVAGGARIAWLPQETILFDRSALDRMLEVDLDTGATLLAIEPMVFGRTAMGERIDHLDLTDRWRIRIDNRLVFAENGRLAGAAGAALRSPGLGGGAHGFALGLYVGPDPEDVCTALMALPRGPGLVAGVGVVRGLVSFRLVATDARDMRAWIAAAHRCILSRPVPVVWAC